MYRARDLRLDREVAVKVLAPEVAASPDQVERFLREARVLASLDHPNIVAVHSVEESGGLHFLTMALVRGRTLDEVIPDEGMPQVELLPLARSIAQGIAAAHARGIVHRDVKSANVMVTERGGVKLVDFGLAKAEALAGLSTELTGEGVAVGTVPYMSPEQLRGAAVDARSDLFSLGVVLYEMAAGRRPFAGDSAAEVITAILEHPPPPLIDRKHPIAPGFRAVVERCLRKDPGERYASAGEVLRDLEAIDERPSAMVARSAPARGEQPAPPLRTELPLPTRPSLAVLPFRNLSGEEHQHLATGLWFDLNAELVKLAGLFLLNGTSTATLDGHAVEAKALGRRLGVRHLLQGTVRVIKDRVRITVQLVETSAGRDVWADSFESGIDDLFEMQDQIFSQIIEELDVQLLYGEGVRTMRSHYRSRKARDLIYRALPLSFSSRLDDLIKARRLLDDVERIEPQEPQTYSHRGWTYYFEATSGWCEDEATAIERAAAYAEQAVEHGDSSGMGKMLLAAVRLMRGEHERAVEEGQAALDQRPGCPWAYAVLGNIYNYTGEPHKAMQLASQAIRLSPLVPDLFPAVLATSCYLMERYEDAIAAGASAIELDPERVDAHLILAAALVATGQDPSRHVVEVRRLKPDFSLEDYAHLQPFRNQSPLEKLLADLRRAGL